MKTTKKISLRALRKMETADLMGLASKPNELDPKTLNNLHTVIVEANQGGDTPNADIIKIDSKDLSKLQKSYKNRVLLSNEEGIAYLLVEDEFEALKSLKGNKIEPEELEELDELVEDLKQKQSKNIKKLNNSPEAEKGDLFLDKGLLLARKNKDLKLILELNNIKFPSKVTKSQLVNLIVEGAKKAKNSTIEIIIEENIKKSGKKSPKTVVVIDDYKEKVEEGLDNSEILKTAKVIKKAKDSSTKKYKKTGVRHETYQFPNGEEVSRGEMVCFEIKKQSVIGEFRHVNINVHSPEGYAVIKYEGKIYERTLNKVERLPSNDEEE